VKGEIAMLRVADFIVKCLEQEGVEYVFGEIGHTAAPLCDALYDSSIHYVSTRHEQIGAHAADAYARVSHKPGVLLLHVGPGLANAVVGVANAGVDGIPMIVLAGDVPSYHFGKEPFQELRLHADASQWEVFRPFVKRAWRLHRADAIPTVMAHAFNAALSGRPGPVLIDLPLDLLLERVDADVPDLSRRRPTGDEVVGDLGAIEQAAKLLVEAESPVIYADGLAMTQEAGPEITALAEYLGIPVATTGLGKGLIPEDHALSVGVTGLRGCGVAHELTRSADVLLAVGTTFPEVESSSWDQERIFVIPPTRLIQIDSEAREIGKIYPVEVGIVGHSKGTLAELIRVVEALTPKRAWEESPRTKEIVQKKAEWDAQFEEPYASDAVPMVPDRLVKEVRDVLPKDGIVVTDVGFNKYIVHQQMPFYAPQTMISPGSFAPMGFGGPAALGAKLAAPDKPVVSLVGDGGFSSTETMLTTAAEYNIPAVWVVMNNYVYGVVVPIQKARYGGRMIGTEFKDQEGEPYNPDFAASARAHGVEGVRVEKPDDFKPALEEALSSGKPYLLDVVVSPAAAAPMNGIWDMFFLHELQEQA
jgi:acetolactate synthase-1/2/3 large subunit